MQKIPILADKFCYLMPFGEEESASFNGVSLQRITTLQGGLHSQENLGHMNLTQWKIKNEYLMCCMWKRGEGKYGRNLGRRRIWSKFIV